MLLLLITFFKVILTINVFLEQMQFYIRSISDG